MPLNLASPGIVVREVDLTVGRVDPTSASIGAIVSPFAQGPVEVPTIVGSEKDLLEVFGRPYGTDKHYEHWLTASSFLAYGGSLSVVRADDDGLINAMVGAAASIKIKSLDHYEELGYDENTITDVVVAARNPGLWANGLRVGIIDAKADQILSVGSTTGLSVGLGVSQSVPAGTVIAGAGNTSTLDGYFKGIITGVGTDTIDVKFVSHVSSAGTETSTDYQYSGNYAFSAGEVTTFVGAGAGSTSANVTRGALGSTAATASSGDSIDAYFLESTPTLDQVGGTPLLSGSTTVGIATANLEVGSGKFLVIGNEIISLSGASIGVGQITGVTRGQEGTSDVEHSDGAPVKFVTKTAGIATLTSDITQTSTNVGLTTTAAGLGTDRVNAGGFLKVGSEFVSVTTFLDGESSIQTPTAAIDWFDQQELTLTSSSKIKWNEIADRPGTSEYAAARGSRFDEVHVVVVDGEGTVTGNSGTVLEKHLGLSKAKDAEYSLGSPSYWRKYIEVGSQYIFGGSAPVGIVTTGFSSGYTPASDVGWDQNAEGIIFAATGNYNGKFEKGASYGGKTKLSTPGTLTSGLDGLVTGYGLFENTEKYDVDFILMGSAGYGKYEAQALAKKCIAVAEARQDAIAFISPYRAAAIADNPTDREVTIRSDADITENVLSFYAPITSSTYAIFDSGYKYMFDRFANTFRYVPLNGDIAGLCARNDANNFPWFSPAGTNRGGILNAVKLAYTPNKAQRDRLYSNRINPVIFSPGAGIVLFGDKTGYGKSSAFDRINVRRLFIYLEDAISAAAKDQLFEFNDEITRTNFVNIVEPFLRDVQAKRGIFDFVVVCDETNNTAAVIDNNEFVADIYIKPARSINFIGLTFVATRTGVSFEEVIGNV